MISYLCTHAPSLIPQVDRRGRTALFYACVSGFPESVAILLQHGAEIDVVDNEGLTPLHACAEFSQEQEAWETAKIRSQSDNRHVVSRCRPFLSRHGPTEMHDLGGHPRNINIVISPPHQKGRDAIQIQRPLHSIIAVLRTLLDHATRSKTVKLPQIKASVAQYVKNVGGKYTNAMVDFLEAHLDGEGATSTLFEDLNRQALGSFVGVPLTPENFLASCTLSDVRRLRTGTLGGLDYFVEVPEFSDIVISRDVQVWKQRFLELVAKSGLTEVLLALTESEEYLLPDQGHAGERDERTKLILLGKHLQARELRWMLQKACESSSSNLIMVQTLVQKLFVDVNINVDNGTDDAYLIHWLAKGKHYWHIDALCYAAANGGGLDTQNTTGQTALHVACQQEQSWSGTLVSRLLQLNADFELKDEDGKTCAQMVRAKTVMGALENYSVPMLNSASLEDLLLAIGRLDVDWVQLALRSGLGVDEIVEDPLWTEEYYDSGYSGSPIHNGWPATPLLGALQFSQHDQEFWTKNHKDARAAIIRLLIEAGSNLLEPIQMRHLDVYAEVVSEREQPPREYCEGLGDDEDLDTLPFLHCVFKYVRSLRRHLTIFFEYPDKMKAAVNVRGGSMDETLFLAACNSKLDCKPRGMSQDTVNTEGKDPEENSEDFESGNGESAWIDATGFYLQMMDLGADVSLTDKEGNNALVSKLLLVHIETIWVYLVVWDLADLAAASFTQESLRSRTSYCSILVPLGARTTYSRQRPFRLEYSAACSEDTPPRGSAEAFVVGSKLGGRFATR